MVTMRKRQLLRIVMGLKCVLSAVCSKKILNEGSVQNE